MCFYPVYLVFFLVILALFELNLACFPSEVRKEERHQNLLFLTISVQVELYKRKPETKEAKLRNDVKKLYLQNHEKTRTSWLIFGEDKKKEAR